MRLHGYSKIKPSLQQDFEIKCLSKERGSSTCEARKALDQSASRIFHNKLKLLTCEEAISSMPASDMTEQLRTVLDKANTEMRLNGAGLTWGYVLALGMKPG